MKLLQELAKMIMNDRPCSHDADKPLPALHDHFYTLKRPDGEYSVNTLQISPERVINKFTASDWDVMRTRGYKVVEVILVEKPYNGVSL